MSGRIAIGLMCKAPRPGFAKTRLAATLGPDRAAALAAAFIADSAARVARIAARLGIEPLALFTPADAGAEVAALLPGGFALAPQAEGDLGERMALGIAALHARGGGASLLTGTDLPTLPASLLVEAIEAVTSGRAEVALVPVTDGGYGAIAVSRPAPALFRGIAWSTPGVTAATAAAAHRAGLRCHRTAPWYDVDEPGDLAVLRAELAGRPPAECAAPAGEDAPATRRALAVLGGMS